MSLVTELTGRTATELAALVRAGGVSAEEVVRAHLERIAAADGAVGAFRVVRVERSLEEARAVDAHPARASLPLAGVPVAIKDNIPVRGEATRAGSPALPDTPADRDHEVVRRLRAAGAVVIGITRTPELCIWATSDGAFGAARSPWNPERTAGGSSGGSAAAVAAGMVPLAHGSDGLGSIRIPAAVCGVFGMKPGPGTVPADLGANAWYGLAENGPLAANVNDAALMLSVMAARADLMDVPEPGRLRIAVSTRAPVAGLSVDPHHARAAREIGALLRAEGHDVHDADPSYPVRYAPAIMAHWFAGPVPDAEPLDERLLEARTRRHLRMGRLVLRVGLVRERDRAAWRRVHQRFFSRFDVLLTPVLAAPPPVAAGWSRRSWLANVIACTRYAPFSASWNFAGFPAASVPAGLHPDGTPLAVQVVAAAGHDARVLGVARQIEALRPWTRHALRST